MNTVGVLFTSMAFLLFSCVQFTVYSRTGIGLLFSALIVALGEHLSKKENCPQSVWSGNLLVVTGYLSAAFYALATFYVNGVQALSSPFPAWGLELCLALFATLHGGRNKILRYAALPYTLLLSAHALSSALASGETLALAGFTVTLPAAASLFGVLYLAGLSAIYKKLELACGTESALSKRSYRVAHESYFMLTALNALALPKFFASMEYAPLWWALETPVLLALCWRSSSFVKHALVMGIWSVSAVLVFFDRSELAPYIRMAVPVSGIVVAMAYRNLHSAWAQWQKVTGYALYLYGAVAVALAIPLYQLPVWEAMPFFLAQAGVLLVLSLALRDRILLRVGCLAAAGGLALYAARFEHWDWSLVLPVVLGCYGMSLLFGRIKKKGGLPQSEFVPLKAELTLSAGEAGNLEIGAGVLGYLSMMTGSYLLFASPFNTISWGVEALGLIAFGFFVRKLGHRFSGLLAMAVASAKLTIFDLSGAGTATRTLVSFGAVGICCLAASIFYLVEYGREDNDAPPPDGQAPSAD
ncbi:MAG: hypothetical protein K2X27_07385 [Candidatus Obscuribacterales bacterium]|nr:hypothetical protein [Candidatus Obscuribacterales bacterium]